MRFIKTVLVALLALVPLAAHATPVTDLITFTATGAATGAASGQFTLTFDPTQTYSDATSGLAVVYLLDGNPAVVPAGFNYDPQYDQLRIGGLVSTVAGLQGLTDDFALDILNSQTAPTFYFFASSTSSAPVVTLTFTGTASVTPVVVAAPTPEPSSLLLLGTGIAGCIGLVRRKSIHNSSQIDPVLLD